MENRRENQVSEKKKIAIQNLEAYRKFRYGLLSSDQLPPTEERQKPWLDEWKREYGPAHTGNETKRHAAIDTLNTAIGAFTEYKSISAYKNKKYLADSYEAMALATKHLRDYIQGNSTGNRDEVDYSLRLLQDTYHNFFADDGHKRALNADEDMIHSLLGRLKAVDIVKDPPPLDQQFAAGAVNSIKHYYEQQSSVCAYQEDSTSGFPLQHQDTYPNSEEASLKTNAQSLVEKRMKQVKNLEFNILHRVRDSVTTNMVRKDLDDDIKGYYKDVRTSINQLLILRKDDATTPPMMGQLIKNYGDVKEHQVTKITETLHNNMDKIDTYLSKSGKKRSEEFSMLLVSVRDIVNSDQINLY